MGAMAPCQLRSRPRTLHRTLPLILPLPSLRQLLLLLLLAAELPHKEWIDTRRLKRTLRGVDDLRSTGTWAYLRHEIRCDVNVYIRGRSRTLADARVYQRAGQRPEVLASRATWKVEIIRMLATNDSGGMLDDRETPSDNLKQNTHTADTTVTGVLESPSWRASCVYGSGCEARLNGGEGNGGAGMG